MDGLFVSLVLDVEKCVKTWLKSNIHTINHKEIRENRNMEDVWLSGKPPSLTQ